MLVAMVALGMLGLAPAAHAECDPENDLLGIGSANGAGCDGGDSTGTGGDGARGGDVTLGG